MNRKQREKAYLRDRWQRKKEAKGIGGQREGQREIHLEERNKAKVKRKEKKEGKVKEEMKK
jgi:hypothetical protein